MVSGQDAWAVGEYDVPGYAPMTLTEHWDGSTWTRIPSPNPDGNRGSSLLAVEGVSETDVWAVGEGFGKSPRVRPLIEHWDGSAWSITTPGRVPNAHITGLNAVTAISPSNVWAVGSCDDDITHYTYALIEHWGRHELDLRTGTQGAGDHAMAQRRERHLRA
jgi:hypothetical protein